MDRCLCHKPRESVLKHLATCPSLPKTRKREAGKIPSRSHWKISSSADPLKWAENENFHLPSYWERSRLSFDCEHRLFEFELNSLLGDLRYAIQRPYASIFSLKTDNSKRFHIGLLEDWTFLTTREVTEWYLFYKYQPLLFLYWLCLSSPTWLKAACLLLLCFLC